MGCGSLPYPTNNFQINKYDNCRTNYEVWTCYDISNSILSLLMLRRYSFILYNDTFTGIYKNNEGNITPIIPLKIKKLEKYRGEKMDKNNIKMVGSKIRIDHLLQIKNIIDEFTIYIFTK